MAIPVIEIYGSTTQRHSYPQGPLGGTRCAKEAKGWAHRAAARAARDRGCGEEPEEVQGRSSRSPRGLEDAEMVEDSGEDGRHGRW